jgi:hypothetical protein
MEGTAMATTRVVGSFREWLNARETRRMVRRQRFPESLQRNYWDRAEFTKDAAELEALGYAAASTEENDPYVTATLPAASNGVSGHLDRTRSRRVAAIHVLYTRQPASTSLG